ncbi:MAG TPA: hypothetical protein PLH75_07320, partial [Amaricoccus sp.]|nr:hypothetical protein [Amaricoccus sp.]
LEGIWLIRCGLRSGRLERPGPGCRCDLLDARGGGGEQALDLGETPEPGVSVAEGLSGVRERTPDRRFPPRREAFAPVGQAMASDRLAGIGPGMAVRVASAPGPVVHDAGKGQSRH